MESKNTNSGKKTNIWVSIGGLIALLASIATIIGLSLQWQQTKVELATAEDARINAESDIAIKETSLAIAIEVRDLQATMAASGNYSAPLQATFDELNNQQSIIAPNLPTVSVPPTTTHFSLAPTSIATITSIFTATSPTESTTCNKWNLATDFRVWPNQENPNRDSCGNSDVWNFMSQNNLERSVSSYFLISDFSPDALGRFGFGRWEVPSSSYGGVYFNNSNSPFRLVKPGNLMIHTDSSRLVIIGWRSPLNGEVRVIGSIIDADDSCGDGIFWFVDKDDLNIAYGNIDNGGGQEFQRGNGGGELLNILVSKSEFIYFIFHPKGGSGCDSTLVQLQIESN